MQYRLQTRRRLVPPNCQVHVVHGFVSIRIWDRVSTSAEISNGRTAPKESLLVQRHPAVQQNGNNVSPHSKRLCLRASASRSDFLSFKPRHEDEERAKASEAARQSTTCEQYTHLTRIHTRNFFSCVWLKFFKFRLQCSLCAFVSKSFMNLARMACFARCLTGH